MIQVNVRDGIFNGGGYGGGVFDGTTMGFGGLGATGCGDSSGCGVAGLGLSATPTYTWRAGDTGTSVAKAITGNGSRWTELAAANPSHKCTQYGFCAKAGDVVTLPASWVAAAAPAPAPAGTGPMGVDATDWSFAVKAMQGMLNQILTESGYRTIGTPNGVLNAATLGAFKLVSTLTTTASASKVMLSDMVNEVWDTSSGQVKFGQLLQTASAAIPTPWPTPAASGGAVTPPVTDTTPCDVEFGDHGTLITELQGQVNALLAKNGYEPIPVTATWDASTCGALFVLQGQWDPTSQLCPGGVTVPATCPAGVTPIQPKPKPAKPEEPHEKTGMSMAWMLGGLIGAAALAGLYGAMKKK